MIDLPVLIQQCAPTVAPSTMMKIIAVESSGQAYIIGTKITKGKKVHTLARQPRSKEEAISWATWLYQGGYRFDAGIAQVNSIHFARLGLTPQTAFEPCQNIAAGGQILTEEYRRAAARFGPGQRALFAAISSYNTGNFSGGFANGYVPKVVNANINRFHATPIFR